MKKALFTGVSTALVTPFCNNLINIPMLETLLQRQIDAGIRSVVVAGTTGEGATLSDAEKVELLKRCRNYAGNQLTVIAGTGSNDTEHSIALSKKAEEAGADGILVVCPYYNKPTESGLIEHYTAIAKSVNLPIILYNVPTRTGTDMSVDVYRTLSAIDNIIGVKEASSNIAKIIQIRAKCPEDFYIWAGNDDMAVPVAALGGIGVISVLSNLLPNETKNIMTLALNGEFNKASEKLYIIHELIELLFSEANPIPIKAALKKMGYDCGECRLPLTKLSKANQQKLDEALGKFELG